MNLVQWYSHKIQDTTKYSVPINRRNYYWDYAIFKKVILKLLKWNNKSWEPSIILNMYVKKEWPYPVYKDSWKKICHHFLGNLFGRNYMRIATKWQNWRQIQNHESYSWRWKFCRRPFRNLSENFQR